jgi:alkylated DNA nucleotide flippase Atl1
MSDTGGSPTRFSQDDAGMFAPIFLRLASDLERAFGRARESLEAELKPERKVEVPAVSGSRQRQIASLPGLFNPRGMTAPEISRATNYDGPNTYTVLEALTRIGLLELIDGTPRRWRIAEKYRRDRMLRVTHLVHSGEWTTYGDIAVAAFNNWRMARAVGQSAQHNPAFNAPHRVLSKGGTIAPEWTDGQGGDMTTCRQLLEDEGVSFNGNRANPAHYVGFQELTERLQRAEDEDAAA